MPTSKPTSAHASPFQLGILAIGIALSFRSFHYFPGMASIQEIFLAFLGLTLFLVYLPWRWRHRWGLWGFEVYIFFILLLLPIWSALAAQQEFGQPLFFGLLAQRSLVMVAAVPLLTKMVLSRTIISLTDIERALLLLAWTSLCLYFFMTVFLDPGPYFLSYPGFATSPGPDARFAFSPTFLVFGFLFYGFRGIRTRANRDYLRAAPFLLFMFLLMRGRSLTLSLLATFLFLTINWTSSRALLLRFFVISTAGIVLVWGGLYYFTPDFYSNLTSKFSSAFTVAFTGESTSDASANARIEETITAIPYIVKNWALGSGLLSNQWNEGFKTVFGYFHPSDIGLFGTVFLYGAFGTILYLVPFRFAHKAIRSRVPIPNTYQSLSQTAKGMVVYIGIRSLATGEFVFHAEILLFFIAILYSIQTKSNLKSADIHMTSTKFNPTHNCK